jgi:predicted AAA+ superfamily ATPase
MHPMSLTESGHSHASVSLSGLFDGIFDVVQADTDLHDIAAFICRGGWPGALSLNDEEVMLISDQYINTLLSSSAAKQDRSEQIMRRLLYSLARNIGKAVSKKTLLADIQQGEHADEDSSITRPTLDRYLDTFADRYLIEELPGWDAPVKSRSRLRIGPVRTFADPSIPAALLGMSPERLFADMQTFGNLFEELCLRDLRVYTSVMKDSLPVPLRRYRDPDGLEVDAIIELRDGRWAALEIKLSENKVSEAVSSLMRLKRKIAANPTARNPEPSFMAVITGKSEFCRQTPEGVFVVPITELTA